MEKSPEEIAMDASLKATIGSKFDLTDVPAPADPTNPGAGFDALLAPTTPTGDTTKPAGDPVVEKLLERIATMESRWDADRKDWEARLSARVSPTELPEPHVEPPAARDTRWDDFLSDPAGVASREGIPFDFIAASLVRAQLQAQGRSDPSLDAKLGQYPVVRQMTGQVATLAAQIAAMQAERAEEQYQVSLSRASAKVEKDKYPLVAGASAIDADAVAEELRDIVLTDARGKSPTAPRMAPEKAIEVYEKRLALAKRLTSPVVTSPQTTPAGTTSPKIPPATAANLSGNSAPTVAQNLADLDAQLRAEIVRKHPN